MSYRYNYLVKNPRESKAHLLAEGFFAFFGQLTGRVCLGGLCRELCKEVKQKKLTHEITYWEYWQFIWRITHVRVYNLDIV